VTDTQPPFETVTIAGIGLIGGSIALGLREQWPSVRITGVDRPAVLAHALSSNAIDRGASDLAAAADADLVILAAPVAHNVHLLRELAPRVRPTTVVTDVGGTKRDIVAAAREVMAPGAFIGGHPIGGAERGGFGFARPDLFVDRPWLFTPDEERSGAALERLFAFARGLRAQPATIEAATHDRLMAYVSHLPQLTATALMRVAGQGANDEGLTLSGRGLLDTTRLASSPASVWTDICAANSDCIAQALDELIATLQTLRAGLGKSDAIEDLFSDAARWRAELLKLQHARGRGLVDG
jgi:prephenate dehydrogenase